MSMDEEQSLVGLAPAADAQSQVGIPAPTPEEIEAEKRKIEELHEELLKKKELGLYSEKDLLEESGKKVLVDKSNTMVGVDAQTGAQLVKANSGAWLAPSDPAYEKTLNDVAVLQAGLNSTQEGEERKRDKQAQEQNVVYDQAVQQIQTQTAINEGSVNAHKGFDEAELQRVRQGASTPEVLKIAATVAATDGFASIVPDDHSPERDVNKLKPTTVTGRGAELAMEAVRRRKEKENAEFAARMQREKEKDKNKKA